ncbi:hypothetical protein [Sphingobacterium detergens]|uniref:Uncharacterized protein n=1 Tax=Sphingobacterium detergens TaxID=1145106 RepID=A0A420B6H6_SPHD1|nr:hypothetical protein [Sphingobacterium detergens]RKE52317.1 hypothetical protein DFQ12_2551 [Sphingobacterium detergens]
MKKKEIYLSPVLGVYHVEMEHGIAAGSTNSLSPGGASNNPQIEDWQDNGSVGENSVEL